MTSPIEPTARYTPHPEALQSRLGDETVILHLGSGTYFGLDPVGTIVWERLQAGDVPAAICAHVRATFPDAADAVDSDVTVFLQQLLDAALIERD